MEVVRITSRAGDEVREPRNLSARERKWPNERERPDPTRRALAFPRGQAGALLGSRVTNTGYSGVKESGGPGGIVGA